ncbi:MAG: nucleotidyl transferase AbiEii/AbiGii toxin family protein [Actinoallomurus sp.]
MTTRLTRATAAGRVYLDLQNKARREHRPTDELHQLYALEGFLARVTQLPYSNQLVIKGGVLLAAYDVRRPTRDIDVQGQHIPLDAGNVVQMVREIAAIALDDGLEFDTAAATASPIRDEDEYGGIRIGLTGRLATARLSLHIDVNVGDPIWPGPQPVTLPRLLGGELHLTGYPLPMILAEKIITAVERGTANTRWRDFADICTLAQHHRVMGSDLESALTVVAEYRHVELSSLRTVLDGYPALAQPRWVAWRRRIHLEDRLPESFADVLAAVIALADPALGSAVSDRYWSPDAGRWS